jgi:hypothetical protein
VGGALLVPAHELPKQHLRDELCNDDYIRFATCGTFETLEPLQSALHLVSDPSRTATGSRQRTHVGRPARPVLVDWWPAGRAGRISVGRRGGVVPSGRSFEAVADLREAELNVEESEALPAFKDAIADGLLVRRGADEVHNEVMYALTDAGRARVGAPLVPLHRTQRTRGQSERMPCAARRRPRSAGVRCILRRGRALVLVPHTYGGRPMDAAGRLA